LTTPADALNNTAAIAFQRRLHSSAERNKSTGTAAPNSPV